jgi:ubiquinone/menaquinone biosynthesis C-methylase UbiE
MAKKAKGKPDMDQDSSGPNCMLEDTAAFYNRLAYDYDRLFAYSAITTRVQATWLKLKLRKGMVLDLGCGTGRMLTPLSEKGFKTVGLDCADRMLAVARCRLPGSALVYADACHALPFKDASFENVISLHASVIHQTGWPELMVMSREVLRVLKPKGRFVVEIPHPGTYPGPEDKSHWSQFQPGVTCRALDNQVREVRLHQLDGLTTRVRVFEQADVEAWLNGYSKVDLFENYTHLPHDPAEGEVMVICAEK